MKICNRCAAKKPSTEFAKRSASHDGLAAACKACINRDNQLKYYFNAEERDSCIARTTANKQARFDRDPAYRRAFNLWGSVKKRTKIPSWASIMDFYAICVRAVRAGPDSHIDHIIPINHSQVCGLHVPWNLRVTTAKKNNAKGSKFKTDWE